jgi:hypothetical protein
MGRKPKLLQIYTGRTLVLSARKNELVFAVTTQLELTIIKEVNVNKSKKRLTLRSVKV